MFYNQDLENLENISGMDINMDNCENYDGIVMPVCECPIRRCTQRDIHHTVEHIVPINTKIINNHIYHHVYKPIYSCTEENICTNTCSKMM